MIVYIDELDAIENTSPTSLQKKREWAMSYFCESYADIIPCYDNKKLVGFVIICSHPECHPACDWFIAQTYLKPEYQRKGIMSSRVREFIRHHQGKYCLFIVDNNEAAKRFWTKVFEGLGYEKFWIPDIATPERCTQYGYEPKVSSCM